MLEGRVRHRVEFGETDAVGVVYYPNYYRWFDRGTHELLRLSGYPLNRMFADGIATPLAETGARFLSPLRYDDELEIVSRAVEVGNRSFRVGHQIWHEGSLIAEGHEIRVCVEFPQPASGKLRSTKLPDALRGRLLGAAPVDGARGAE